MNRREPLVMFYNPFSTDGSDRFVCIYEEDEKKEWEERGFVFHASGSVTVQKEM